MRLEIGLTIPEGFQLVGTRTKGNAVVVVFEPKPYKVPEPEQQKRRRIGFVQDPEPAGNNKK